MGPNARLRLIRDRFITGHPNYALRRHFEADNVKPTPERVRPVNTVSEPACVAVTASSVGIGDLEALLRRLLSMASV